jgi:hypothetical protein
LFWDRLPLQHLLPDSIIYFENEWAKGYGKMGRYSPHSESLQSSLAYPRVASWFSLLDSRVCIIRHSSSCKAKEEQIRELTNGFA